MNKKIKDKIREILIGNIYEHINNEFEWFKNEGSYECFRELFDSDESFNEHEGAIGTYIDSLDVEVKL